MSLGVVAVAAVLLGWSARYCSSETTNDAGNGTYPFGSYTDWDRMERYLEQLANDNDKFVRLVDIGETNQGRRLRGLKIGTSNGQNNVTGTNTGKRAIWIDGGNHAREWPAFHTVLVFIHKLVDGYNNGDPNITAYIHKLDFYLFPCLNPDGLEFSRTAKRATVRQWRKNRAPNNCSGNTGWKGNACCAGVDLNRNYDFHFRQSNKPFNNPCSDEFQGPNPFSEPESRAVRDFAVEVGDQVDALLSLHTHGQLWIIPYNHKKGAYTKDHEDLFELAEQATAALKAVDGNEYKIGTAADLFGPASGGATDWIKANTRIKYVYVVELPPELTTWFAFQMKPHWLMPTAEETWAAVKVIIEHVIEWREL